MIRTHKIALNPSPRQLAVLEQCATSARKAYNGALACFRETIDAGSPCPVSMLLHMWQASLPPQYPPLDDAGQNAAKYAVYALGAAIESSQDSGRGNKFPRPHGPDHRPAFRTAKGKDIVRCEGKRIELPNIGSVRMHEPLRFTGSIPMVTITHEAERWWACVVVEMKNPSPCPGGEIIGVDLGVSTIAVASDETWYEIPEAMGPLRREIGCLTMRQAKQVQGSGRYDRTLRQLQEVRYQAKCLREEAQHRAANDIVAKARVVVMEDLDIIDMMNQGGKRLAGGIARAAMRSLQEKIAYRCEAAGVRLVRVPGDFPSTRMCSGCGELREMPLKKRIYECSRCDLVLDRDLNAALNLKQYGEREPL